MDLFQKLVGLKWSLLPSHPENFGTLHTCSNHLKTLSFSRVASQGFPSVLLHVSLQPSPSSETADSWWYLDPGKWTSYLVDKEDLGHTSGIRAVQGYRKWKTKNALTCGVFKERDKGVSLSKCRKLRKCTLSVDLHCGVSNPLYTKQGFCTDCTARECCTPEGISVAVSPAGVYSLLLNCTWVRCKT